MTFFGRRFLKILIFCIGFLVGGWISASTLPMILKTTGIAQSWDAQSLAHLKIGLIAVISICFGLLAHFFWKVAIFLSGCGGGFLIAGWTSLLLPASIFSTIPSNLYLMGWALVGGLLALWLEPYVIMGTSIVCGSYSMVLGMDQFMNLGVARHVKEMSKYDVPALERLPAAGWGLITAGALFATVGLFVQCSSFKKGKK